MKGGIMADKHYILSIHKDGQIRYAAAEGRWIGPKDGDPFLFTSRTMAIMVWSRYCKAFPADAVDWTPRITEAEEQDG